MIRADAYSRRCRAKVRTRTRYSEFTIEPLEPRRMFNTVVVQVQIETKFLMVSRNFQEDVGLSLDFKFNHVAGTVTLTGDNLTEQTKPGGYMVTGTPTAINDINISSSTATSSISVSANPQNPMDLGSFEITNPMLSITLASVEMTGPATLIAAPHMTLPEGQGATIDITQNIPTFILTGDNYNDSTINVIAPTVPEQMNLDLKTAVDTQFVTSDFINSLTLHNYTESTADSGGITAEGVGTFNVLGDYKADLTFHPSSELKYTIDRFNISGTGSGTWSLPGPTRMLKAKSFDTGFDGTFGSLGSLLVGTNFSGTFSAGSLGMGTVGDDLIGANLDFTNPWSANSWNLGSFHVDSTIENSTILSNGNLGEITTMYTFYTRIAAGISSSWNFGDSLSPPDYLSDSMIKSFVSDCPSFTNDHFIGSYVGAYSLSSIRLGNIQTDNGGTPFGLAGYQMGKVNVKVNSKPLYFMDLNSAADFDAGLQKYDYTPQSLGDFTLQFAM